MKTLTLKEAYEKATPGPLRVKRDKIDDCHFHLLHDDKWGCVHVAQCDIINTTPTATTHNAALLAHAFNVLPEVERVLLDALNRLDSHDEQSAPEALAIRSLLAKLNTITIP